MAAIPVTLVGATGITGSATLSALLSSPGPFAVTALTRRAAPASATPPNTYTNRVLADISEATTAAEPLVANGGVYVSCLATTRAAAGYDEKLKEYIDLTLNRELAARARKDGANTMILVSAVGASASSWFAYPRMKGELEDAIKAMGFERVVFIRPATILHDNERPDAEMIETVLIKTIKCLRAVGVPTLSLGVDARDIGAAIAQLARDPPDGVRTLGDHEVFKLAQAFRAAR